MFIISDVFIYSTLSLGQGVCIVYCYLMVITNSGAGSGLLKRSRLAIFNLRPLSSTIDYLIDWAGNEKGAFFNWLDLISVSRVHFGKICINLLRTQCRDLIQHGKLANFARIMYKYFALAPEQLSNSEVETSNLFAA